MSSDFLTIIKHILLDGQLEEEWVTIVSKEFKDTVRLWNSSYRASCREEVMIARICIVHSMNTHRFLMEHGGPSQ